MMMIVQVACELCSCFGGGFWTLSDFFYVLVSNKRVGRWGGGGGFAGQWLGTGRKEGRMKKKTTGVHDAIST
jgi:hypothetical protein